MAHLTQKFFEQKTLKVAEQLIGCFLCRKINGKVLKFKITETEAYVGAHDLACHSSKGKTLRNSPMFEEAGTIYVYLVYGMHWMLNVVTEQKNFPSAVLIRGIEGISGPARLTKKLKIDKKLNGKIAIPKNGLWFEKSKDAKLKTCLAGRRVKKTPRIGVDYAGVIWANKKYRFVLEN